MLASVPPATYLRGALDLANGRVAFTSAGSRSPFAYVTALRAFLPASGALGDGAANISPRAATAVAGGWLRREAGVELRDVSYGEAALFLAAAAESVPAWRLREIEISPSAQAGRGAMVLLLESLEKKRP